MPVSAYDRYFSRSKGGAAAEVLAALVKEYGRKRGTSIFYAMVNKKRARNSGQSSA